MIISTKYLITGDGKTVLTDKAVYIGEDGKIGKIAPKEELLKEFPQEEVKEYGDEWYGVLWHKPCYMLISPSGIPFQTIY